MTKNRDEFLKLMAGISQSYQLINALRYTLVEELPKLQTLWNNPAKASAIESHCPSFKSFLAENGKSFSQALYLIKIGNYITSQGIEMEDLVENGIPISVIELLRKNGVEWNEDVFYEILTKDYPKLVEVYGKKKTTNNTKIKKET